MTTATKTEPTDDECAALAKTIQRIIDEALTAKASDHQLADAVLALSTAGAALLIIARRRGVDRKTLAAALSTGADMGLNLVNRGALRLEPIGTVN